MGSLLTSSIVPGLESRYDSRRSDGQMDGTGLVVEPSLVLFKTVGRWGLLLVRLSLPGPFSECAYGRRLCSFRLPFVGLFCPFFLTS